MWMSWHTIVSVDYFCMALNRKREARQFRKRNVFIVCVCVYLKIAKRSTGQRSLFVLYDVIHMNQLMCDHHANRQNITDQWVLSRYFSFSFYFYLSLSLQCNAQDLIQIDTVFIMVFVTVQFFLPRLMQRA